MKHGLEEWLAFVDHVTEETERAADEIERGDRWIDRDDPAGNTRRTLFDSLGELARLRRSYPVAEPEIYEATKRGLAAAKQLGVAVAAAKLRLEAEGSPFEAAGVRRGAASRILQLEGDAYRRRVNSARTGHSLGAVQAYFSGLRDFLRGEMVRGIEVRNLGRAEVDRTAEEGSSD